MTRRRTHLIGGLCALAGTVLVVAPAPARALTPTLSPVPGSPFHTGWGPYAVAFSPDGRLLATSDQSANTWTSGTQSSNNISVFRVDPTTGHLSAIAHSPFATGNTPDSLAFNPDGTLLATADSGAAAVSVFSVDSRTGALRQISGSPFPAGHQPYSVTFSPDGSLLATANGGSDNVSVFSVDPSSGALTPVPGSPFAAGHDSQPNSAQFSPDGRLLAVADAGSGDVSVFSVDPSSGALTPVPGSPATIGSDSQPTWAQFSPDGRLLAVADFASDKVSVFSVNPSTGALTSVTGSPFAGGSRPYSLAFNPDGEMLAVADSALDGNGEASNVSVFSVGGSGTITPIPSSPLAGGLGITSVAFSPNGRLLARTDLGSNDVAVLSVSETATAPPPPTIGFVGVTPRNRRFDLTAGRTYLLRVISATRPVYVDAAPAPGQPNGGNFSFTAAGPSRWTMRVWLPSDIASEFHRWTIGVRIGTQIHDVRIDVEAAAAG